MTALFIKTKVLSIIFTVFCFVFVSQEWDLKCFHYIILAAFKGDCKNISQKMYPENGKLVTA
jgi:hypothetical protein